MRVAMISYHTCPLATLGGKDTGGMNVYVRDLTRQFGRMGIHVDVFTRSQDEHVPHVLHDLGYGNRIVHIPAGPEIPLPKHQLADFIPEFVEKILDFASAKNLHYDLIHSHYWLSGLAARDLKEQWHIPLVHMFHTLGMMKQRVARTEDEDEIESRIQGEKEILHTADQIIAATPAELAQLQWLYKADTQRVVVIPPGVDLSHFYPIPRDEAQEYIGVPPCDRMLLFVGRIEPLKGLDTLIEAIALMRQRGVLQRNGICLIIIGGDPESQTANEEMKRLQKLRKQHGLDNLVAFLGKRNQDTLPYYYSAAIAVIVPSQYESFGMVALEAMACGTPVVASQVGGLAFLVQDGVTGYTVPSGDPQALADYLATLIEKPELRDRLGMQAAAFARDYDWELIAPRIVQVYENLLRKNFEENDHSEFTMPLQRSSPNI